MTISADHTVPVASGEAQPDNALDEADRKFGITVEDYMLPARHQIQMVEPDGGSSPKVNSALNQATSTPCPAMTS